MSQLNLESARQLIERMAAGQTSSDGMACVLAQAWLIEHPADDGEPADFEWLESHATREEDKGYWDVPPSGDVWWAVGCLSFTCDAYQSDPGEAVETVADDWQVEGEKLPKALIPKTRGEFRRLCAALGITLKGAK